MKKYDIVIIGAGTAGLAARREVAKSTENYLVVDDGPLGTTCARVGCMPSKVLIETANVFYKRSQFESLGIHGGDQLTISGDAVLRHVRALRDRFVRSVMQDMDTWSKTHLARKRAHFVAPNTLDIGGEIVEARKIILATGSSPVMPEKWKALRPRLSDTDQFFERETLPKSVAVLGTGVIGLELGQALARLGVRVVAFGKGRTLGGLTDPEIETYARGKLSAEFPIVAEAVTDILAEGDELAVVAGGKEQRFEHVLAAMGRRPNLAGLELEQSGIPLDEKGQPKVSAFTGRIANTDVYLAGDAVGERMILHEAADEGRIAGFNSVQTSDHAFRRRTTLSITFTSPNIAAIGKSHRALIEENANFVSGVVSFEGQGRSIIKGEEKGLLKIYGDRLTGRILGAELFAPAGEHLAHLLAWLIDREPTVFHALSLPFYHPAVEEGVRTALRDLAKKLERPLPPMELLRSEDPPAGVVAALPESAG